MKLSGIWAYEPSICRSLGATYRSKTKYNGIPVVRFEMDMGEKVNEKQCFCRSENECPPKGTVDLFKCSGMPIIASLPHFYKAEQLLEGIESGLNPNKEQHGIEMLFETVGFTFYINSNLLEIMESNCFFHRLLEHHFRPRSVYNSIYN